MNAYEISANQKDIWYFFMTVPDEVFLLRIGHLDVMQGKIKPLKADDALNRIASVFDKTIVNNELLIETIVYRDNEVIQKAVILLTPKDDYTLIGIRHVYKPVKKEVVKDEKLIIGEQHE